MPFQSEWYVPNAVIFSRFWGQTTEEEITRHSELLIAMIEETDRALVHVLVDVSAVTKHPPLTATIRATRATPSTERAGWVVTVGEHDPILRFISNASRQLLQLRTHSFKTQDEALDFLKRIDETVAWSQARSDVLTTSAP